MLTNEQIRKNVQANFKFARKWFGYTQAGMGKNLGLPEKAYAAIEEGRSGSIIHVYRLSLLIGSTMDRLFLTQLSDEIPKSNQ